MNKLGTSLLLFIDNADDMTEDDIQFLCGECSCRVIITTRYENEEFTDYPLPKFSADLCMTAYRKLSKDKRDDDETAIRQILEIADCHIQTVCLLARTQKESGYTAQDLLDALQRSGFSLKGISVAVDSGRPEGNFEATFTEHMSKLFDIAKIREPKQVHVLQLLSLLAPNQPLPRRTANEWFESSALKKLTHRGWLNTDDDGDVLIHPVIAETVKSKYPPDPENASQLINQMKKTLTACRGKGVALQNKLLPHCVSVAETLRETETSSFSWFLDSIAMIMQETGDYDRALSYGKGAVAVSEKVNGTGHPDTASTYNNIANVYYYKGDFDKALEYYNKALAIREKVLGTKHTNTAGTYNNIALVYQYKGYYGKALEYYNKAMTAKEQVLSTEHPSTAMTYNNIAVLYITMGEFDEALEYCNKALAVNEKVLGTEHPDTAITYYNFGDLSRETGKPEEALKYAEQARSVFEQKLGTENPRTAQTYNLLARIHLMQGSAETALSIAEKTKNIYTKKGLAEHLDAAVNFRTLAEIHLAKDETGQAKAYAEQALAILEKKFGAAHPDTRKTYQVLAGIYEKTGDTEKANEYRKKSENR